MNREGLNALPCTAPDHADEAQHFITCAACGQAFDCRLLGDVVHHESQHHLPIPAN